MLAANLFSVVLLAAIALGAAPSPPQSAQVTLFEGARLITGNVGDPGEDVEVIENSAFLVEGGRFTRVGRRGEVRPPEGAARVDLTGKTVMPGLIELHGHLGYRKGLTNEIENFTEENVLDQLRRLAYHGVVAILSLGTDRRELGYALRNELRAREPPDAARYFTGGQGLAMPDAGPGPPMRYAPYGISTETQARWAIREMASYGVDYVKVWVDDRGGTMAKLPLPVAAAAIDEAQRYDIRAMAHTYTLADSKALLRSGVDGFAHPPWREREPDDELVALFEERPEVFVLMTNWSARNRIYGGRPGWIDDPLLLETFSPEQIALLERPETPADAPAEWRTGAVPRSAARLKEAGVRFGLGSDVGGNSGGPYFGWSSHIEMATMVEAGLSPGEAIVAATRNSAEALGAHQLGMVAPGKSADFLVLDADPLEEIANSRRISAVYLRGREVDRASLREKWRTERPSSMP